VHVNEEKILIFSTDCHFLYMKCNAVGLQCYLTTYVVFLPRDATQSAVINVVYLSVCPSVCPWRWGMFSHSSEYFENNYTAK